MEKFTIKSIVDVVGREFCVLVAQTDFASRYYQLCRQHPLRMSNSFAGAKTAILKISSEIGQTPHCDARDKSYSFDFIFGDWSVTRGFVLQHSAVEFWFLAKRGTQNVGNNYTVIARAAIEAVDPGKVPTPRSPRPECCSHDELRDVLRECFQLSEQLCSLLEKIPRK
jgi:hypothetical protein